MPQRFGDLKFFEHFIGPLLVLLMIIIIIGCFFKLLDLLAESDSKQRAKKKQENDFATSLENLKNTNAIARMTARERHELIVLAAAEQRKYQQYYDLGESSDNFMEVDISRQVRVNEMKEWGDLIQESLSKSLKENAWVFRDRRHIC